MKNFKNNKTKVKSQQYRLENVASQTLQATGKRKKLHHTLHKTLLTQLKIRKTIIFNMKL